MTARRWPGLVMLSVLLLGVACSKATPSESGADTPVSPSVQASPATSPSATSPSATSPAAEPLTGTVQVLGFSGRTGKGANPPSDAVPSGGTWGSCYLDDLKRLNVFLEFDGMADGEDASYAWFLNGTEVFGEDFAWDYGTSGRTVFWIDGPDGEELEDGRWSFELTVAGQVVATGTVQRVTQYC